jgi:hypothetical protein
VFGVVVEDGVKAEIPFFLSFPFWRSSLRGIRMALGVHNDMLCICGGVFGVFLCIYDGERGNTSMVSPSTEFLHSSER